MRYLNSRSKFITLLVTFLTFAFFPLLAAAHTADLWWDASTSQNIVGYNVYRAPDGTGPYTKINSALDPKTSYSDGTVLGGQTYYYVTTAVDNLGVESAYSNQTEAVIPGGGSGSESALYNFGGGSDPKLPYAGLIFDKAGNLYGTTEFGGASNQGTVFEVTINTNGSWTESVLYSFTGGSDGAQPHANLVFDTAGDLYGTSNFGGSANCNLGCGTVFKLTPGSSGWTESVLYTFTGGSDGREPSARVVLDAAGNLYGTTLQGGTINSACSSGCGTIFKLTKGSSSWSDSVLYAFGGRPDGASPHDGLVFDKAGNLYGTTNGGGTSGYGTIFKLARSSSAWTESVLHSFNVTSGGEYPYGGLILDATGNLYGTAFRGATAGFGVVFELLPGSNGVWREKVLHAFANAPSANPVAGLVMDSAGSLYGTTMAGASQTVCGGGCGTLFKLAPTTAGGWTYKVVHSFGLGSDGFHPTGDLILDSTGNMYGTTQAGGAQGSGMIFEMMH